MNEPLDPKVALAYASIAGGLGCIVAGILMNNPSTLAVGAGLLGAPGVAKGVGSASPQEPGAAVPEGSEETEVAAALEETPEDYEPPTSADESGTVTEDVTSEFEWEE